MIMAMYQLGAASDEICAELVSDLQSWIQHLLKYRVKCGKKKLINEKQIAVESKYALPHVRNSLLIISCCSAAHF